MNNLSHRPFFSHEPPQVTTTRHAWVGMPESVSHCDIRCCCCAMSDTHAFPTQVPEQAFVPREHPQHLLPQSQCDLRLCGYVRNGFYWWDVPRFPSCSMCTKDLGLREPQYNGCETEIIDRFILIHPREGTSTFPAVCMEVHGHPCAAAQNTPLSCCPACKMSQLHVFQFEFLLNTVTGATDFTESGHAFKVMPKSNIMGLLSPPNTEHKAYRKLYRELLQDVLKFVDKGYELVVSLKGFVDEAPRSEHDLLTTSLREEALYSAFAPAQTFARKVQGLSLPERLEETQQLFPATRNEQTVTQWDIFQNECRPNCEVDDEVAVSSSTLSFLQTQQHCGHMFLWRDLDELEWRNVAPTAEHVAPIIAERDSPSSLQEHEFIKMARAYIDHAPPPSTVGRLIPSMSIPGPWGLDANATAGATGATCTNATWQQRQQQALHNMQGMGFSHLNQHLQMPNQLTSSMSAGGGAGTAAAAGAGNLAECDMLQLLQPTAGGVGDTSASAPGTHHQPSGPSPLVVAGASQQKARTTKKRTTPPTSITDSPTPATKRRASPRAPAKSNLDFRTICDCMHLSIREASMKLNVCTTIIKRICRVHGILRWPQRKLTSIQKTIDMIVAKLKDLENDPDLACTHASSKALLEEQLRLFTRDKQDILAGRGIYSTASRARKIPPRAQNNVSARL